MKILALAIFFISSSTQASTPIKSGAWVNSLLSEVNQYCSKEGRENSTRCLKSLLSYRCFRYLKGSSIQNKFECLSAVSDLSEELDLYQYENDSKVSNKNLSLKQIAFSRRMLKMFQMPSAQFSKIIQNFKNDLDGSYRFQEKHSLWTRSLKLNLIDREKSLVMIVTLFQDFSSKGYFSFVESNFKNASKRIKNTVHQNLMALNGLHDLMVANKVEQDIVPNYSLFPKIDEVGHLNTLIHHFYIPAYLSLRLTKRGYSAKVASFVSMMFNTEYEFIKLDQKMKTGRWPMKLPLPFNSNSYELQVEKIYTGYRASLWSVGLDSSAMKYEEFKKELSSSPDGHMSKIYFK